MVFALVLLDKSYTAMSLTPSTAGHPRRTIACICGGTAMAPTIPNASTCDLCGAVIAQILHQHAPSVT